MSSSAVKFDVNGEAIISQDGRIFHRLKQLRALGEHQASLFHLGNIDETIQNLLHTIESMSYHTATGMIITKYMTRAREAKATGGVNTAIAYYEKMCTELGFDDEFFAAPPPPTGETIMKRLEQENAELRAQLAASNKRRKK